MVVLAGLTTWVIARGHGACIEVAVAARVGRGDHGPGEMAAVVNIAVSVARVAERAGADPRPRRHRTSPCRSDSPAAPGSRGCSLSPSP